MAPRKSTGSVKRARSISSSLSPDPVETKTIKAKGKANGKASKAAIANDVKVEAAEQNGEPTGTPKRKGRKSATSTTAPPALEETNGDDDTPRKKPRASKNKNPKEEPVESEGAGKEEAEEKPKKKPKAKAFPPPDLDPSTFPPRSGHPIFPLPTSSAPPNGSLLPPGTRPMLLGAHVSIAGGPAGALLRAGKAGANGLAMFVKNQRSWKSNPYEEEAIEMFRKYLKPTDDGGRLSTRTMGYARLMVRFGIPSRGGFGAW